MEYWNVGRMEKNSYKLRVRGKDVLRCCSAVQKHKAKRSTEKVSGYRMEAKINIDV